eukprot:235604-Amorphochlora_amoeboformis.AAC.2
MRTHTETMTNDATVVSLDNVHVDDDVESQSTACPSLQYKNEVKLRDIESELVDIITELERRSTAISNIPTDSQMWKVRLQIRRIEKRVTILGFALDKIYDDDCATTCFSSVTGIGSMLMTIYSPISLSCIQYGICFLGGLITLSAMGNANICTKAKKTKNKVREAMRLIRQCLGTLDGKGMHPKMDFLSVDMEPIDE